MDTSALYEEDETLKKLYQALDDTRSMHLRASLEGAIKDRKKELRTALYLQGE